MKREPVLNIAARGALTFCALIGFIGSMLAALHGVDSFAASEGSFRDFLTAVFSSACMILLSTVMSIGIGLLLAAVIMDILGDDQ